MKRRRAAALIVAVGLALPLLFAGTANASGSFTWTASFKCCLNSRKWFQNGGTTGITSYMNCSGDPGISSYTITLWKDELFDQDKGTKTYPCNSTLTRYWSGLPSGTYYFRLEKRDDGFYISGNGTTAYP